MAIDLEQGLRRAAVPGLPAARLLVLGAALWARLAAAAGAERHRWPLWLPVALGAGAAFYFALPFEPPPAAAWGMLALALAAGAAAWRGGVMSLALLAAFALGLGAAKLREERVAAPILTRTVVTHLGGRLLSADPGPAGTRLVIGDVHSGRFAADAAPARVRVTVRDGAAGLAPGDGVSLTARLSPPPGPSQPGDSDFGRAAFFRRIGAVGFSFGAAHPIPLTAPGWRMRLAAAVERLRERMTAHIRAALPGSRGAIASALVTGERGGIGTDDEAALRDAGLAHVLAIAGLHMALVGGGLFWLVRALLAAIPSVALRYPIKKWAAAAALAGAAFYLLISGAGASAVRAFVMLAMMMLAVLLDRPALSMRNLALAAAVLLLARPESITEPGFQMSFAAVTALVAVAEWEQGRPRLVPRGALYRHLRGIAVTSLVGSLATLPFALFHFGRATHYAVLGNLLAMPVMGLVVMPAAALSVAAMPFGLEAAPLHLLGWGIGVMVAMGRFVSHLPGAVTVAPAFPIGALVLIALGGLWMAIWRRGWRWCGALPMLAGVLLALGTPRPELLVAADARTVAVRGGDGRLHFAGRRWDHYVAARWLLRDGDAGTPSRADGPCDSLRCVAWERGGAMVAVSRDAEALAAECALADIVVSAAPASRCHGPSLVLDAAALAASQGIAVMPGGRIESVHAARGDRPWSVPGVVP